MAYTFLAESLIELAPNKAFVIDGEFTLNNITWNENVSKSDIPKDQAIIEKCKELQADYDAKKYQRDRKYPEIGEQLDKLFHDIDQGKLDKTGGFFKALKAVKDAHPKG